MTYRVARRAFIAACEKAHAETVARLAPGKAPDGMPLFMDCAALGPRHAARAVLAVAYEEKGSGILISLLSEELPADTRLALVHALDPAAFAGVGTDPVWAAAALRSVATEDLSRVRHLGVLSLAQTTELLTTVLRDHLPQTIVTALDGATAAEARSAIARFFAAH